MSKDFIIKIKKLREYYDEPEDIKIIDEREKQLRDLIAQKKFSKNEVVEKIVESAQQEIRQINFLLTYDDSLDDDSERRKALKYQRKVHQFYLSRFSGETADQQLQRITNELDSYLKRAEGDGVDNTA